MPAEEIEISSSGAVVKPAIPERRARLRAGIWVATILVVGAVALNFLHRGTVAFSLYADVTAFTFTTPRTVETNSVVLRSAVIRGVTDVTIDVQPSTAGPQALSVLPGRNLTVVGPSASFTVNSVQIPKDWQISLDAQGPSFTITGTRPETDSTAQPEVRMVSGKDTKLVFTSAEGERQEQPVPSDAIIAIKTQGLSINLEQAPEPKSLEKPSAAPSDAVPTARDPKATILFDHANLTRLDLSTERDETEENGLKTIKTDGTVKTGKMWRDYAPSFLELGPLDDISAKSVKSGVLRNVALKDGAFSIAAHGEAKVLTDTIGETPRDLRPVWLDWLREIGLIQIIIGIVTLIGGFELNAFIRNEK